MDMKLVLQLVCFLGVVWAVSAVCPNKCNCGQASTSYNCTELTEAELVTAIGELTKTPTIVNLTLTNYDPATLKAEAFKNASQITSLTMTGYTKLTSVEADAFKGLTKLTSLTISGSQLTTLPATVFQSLKGTLIMLHLVQNKLKTLPDEIFKDLSKLTTLTLDQNEFVTLKKAHFEPVKTATISVKTNLYDCTCSSNNMELGLWIMMEELKISIQCKLPILLKDKTLGEEEWIKACPKPTTVKPEPTPTPEPEPGVPDWALVIIIAGIGVAILVDVGIFCKRAKRADYEHKKQLEAERGMSQPGHGYDNQAYLTG